MNINILWDEIQKGNLVSCTISDPVNRDSLGILKISIRPIKINEKCYFQVSEHHIEKVFHKNLLPAALFLYVEKIMKEYCQGVFFTHTANYHVLMNRKREVTVIKKALKESLLILKPKLHNKQKKYILEEGHKIPFLIRLGVMSEEGKVIAKKYDKFRQINRFLELVRDVLPHLPKTETLKIIDFGCGKAYLTFALHYYFSHIEKRKIKMVGLDLKVEVIENLQMLTKELELEGLSFAIGDINDYALEEEVDLVISLHACDTATDAAIEKGVKWNARVILSVPCCQKELYSQIKSPSLNSLLRHGILKERFAALVTDAARAELLTLMGYDVQILEFIDMEHTPKNLSIRAVKTATQERKEAAKERYVLFKDALGITPNLEGRYLSIKRE